jgi:hypothetical protein
MACKDLIVPVMSATSLRRKLSSFDAVSAADTECLPSLFQRRGHGMSSLPT